MVMIGGGLFLNSLLGENFVLQFHLCVDQQDHNEV